MVGYIIGSFIVGVSQITMDYLLHMYREALFVVGVP